MSTDNTPSRQENRDESAKKATPKDQPKDGHVSGPAGQGAYAEPGKERASDRKKH